MVVKTIEECIDVDKSIISGTIKKRLNLCAQPFRKRMITTLFRHADHEIFSMENSDDEGPNDFYIGDIKLVFKFKKENRYTILREGKVNNFPRPLTLSDFISDCKRCGIKLEWKATR